MTASGCLLLALGISALFLFDSTYAGQAPRCTERTHGANSSYIVPLGTSYLNEPDTYSYDVSIPQVCNEASVGVTLKVCDFNEEPDVLFISNYQAYATRNDGLIRPATVTGTVYCSSDYILLGSSAGKPKLSVKGISTSRQGQIEYSRETVRVSNLGKAALDQARNQSIIEAHRSAAKATQGFDARQSAAVSRDSPAANFRQAVSDHAHHQAIINALRSDPLFDDSRFNQRRETYKRLRRASQLSTPDKTTESVRDAKVNKAHQAVGQINKQTKKYNRRAELASEALTGNQLPATEQRHSRRAIQSPSIHQFTNSLNSRQAAEEARQLFSVKTLQVQGYLDLAKQQAILDVTRSAQASDIHQAADVVRDSSTVISRQATLDHARQEAILDASRTAQSFDFRQGADAFLDSLSASTRKVTLNRARQQVILDKTFYARVSDLRKAADVVCNNVTAHLRQATLEHARQLAILDATRSAQASDLHQAADVLGSLTAHTRQGALDLARQQAVLDKACSVQASDFRQAADLVRGSLTANTQQAAKNVARQQTILNAGRSQTVNKARLFEHIFDSDRINIHHKVNGRYRRASQTSETCQSSIAADVRQANEARIALENSKRQASLDLSNQQAFEEVNHIPKVAQTSDARQAADKVFQSNTVNNTRKSVLKQRQKQATLETYRPVQALAANNARQADSDQSRQQPIQELNRAISTDESSYSHQVALKDRNAAHDQTQRKNTQESRLVDETDTRRMNSHILIYKRKRRALRTFDTRGGDDVRQDALLVSRSILNNARVQAILDAHLSTQVAPTLEDIHTAADAYRKMTDTVVANSQKAALDQVRLQAHYKGHHNASPASESLSINARHAAEVVLEQAQRQAVLEANLRYDQNRSVSRL